MNGLIFSKLMNYLETEVSTFNKLNSKDWCCKNDVYIHICFISSILHSVNRNVIYNLFNAEQYSH